MERICRSQRLFDIFMLQRKIYILKTGPYNPTDTGLSRYDGFERITTQCHSPHLSDPDYVRENVDLKKVSDTNLIFCSQALRTQETSKIVKGLLEKPVEIEITPCLNEVKFSLKTLLSKEEYKYEGSNFVRKRFIEAFINDTLLEKRAQILERINGLFELLKTQPTERKIVCVSHSFFMKILQSYTEDNSLFNNPKLLRRYFDSAKRTFECCEAFEFRVTYNNLTKVELI